MAVSTPVKRCPESDTSDAVGTLRALLTAIDAQKGHPLRGGLFEMCVNLLRNGCYLIAVVLGLVGAFDRHAEIIGLFLRKGRELDADLFQMQASDLLVQGLRQRIDAHFVGVLEIRRIRLSERLVGEA